MLSFTEAVMSGIVIYIVEPLRFILKTDRSLVHWLFSIVGFGFLALHLIALRRHYFHPLSKFPGPFWASVTGLYQCWTYVAGNEHLVHRELHKKYGPVVRYGPNALIVNDPTMLPAIYHRKADKTSVYAPNFGEATVFTRQSHTDHVAAKRRIAHAYSMTSIKPLEKEMDEFIGNWMSALSAVSTGPKEINFASWAEWLSYDVISGIAFGEPIGFVKESKDVRDLIKNFKDASRFLEVLARLPELSWWVRNTWVGRRVFMAKPTDKSGVGVVMAERDRIFQKHIDSKEQKEGLRGNLWTKFMAAKNADGSPMKIEDVKAEALLAMIAGSSTTATAIIRLVFNILQTPGCRERLTKELDIAAKEGRISLPYVTFDEARQLPFFTACVRETFRFSPSTTQFPRRTSEGGLILNDQFVPPGTSVSASPWILHRNQEMFGADADIFRPDRWLEASPEQLQLWDKYDFRWGYGARKCLGRNIALMEMYKATVQFFRHFRPELVAQTGFTSSGGPLSTMLLIHPRIKWLSDGRVFEGWAS